MEQPMTPPLSPESRQQLQTLAEAALSNTVTNEFVRAVSALRHERLVSREQDGRQVVMSGTEAAREYALETLRASLSALLSALAAQEAENERLRQAHECELQQWQTWGVIEIAVRNPNVSSYCDHWERRAKAAEAELAAVRQSLSASQGKPCVKCKVCGTASEREFCSDKCDQEYIHDSKVPEF